MDDVLDFADQAMFLGERATGAVGLLQCAWVYNRAIDLDGVRRFHHHLRYGRLRRSIQRSPLPFGRHRWVTPDQCSDIEVVTSLRPRAAFEDWLLEQASRPVDAEQGPPWHLAVLPFTDGGAGVSLVLSHCLADGLGLCEALADAACGRDSAMNWPVAEARSRSRAVREDLGQTVRAVPEFGRAAAAAARLAWRDRASAPTAVPAPAAPLMQPSSPDERIPLPLATVFLDADEWDARAESLGGTSNSLFAGLAARLAQRMGRVALDGSIILAMPVNGRTPGDTRANAVTNADIVVDQIPPATDLSGIRATIKNALLRHQQCPDERWALMPLVPLMPKWLVKRMIGVAAGGPSTVVTSNLGAIDPEVTRIDGTAADRFAMLSLFPGVTAELARRANGRLALISGRVHDQMFISVLAYQPNRINTNEWLEHLLLNALDEFSLSHAVTGGLSQTPALVGGLAGNA